MANLPEMSETTMRILLARSNVGLGRCMLMQVNVKATKEDDRLRVVKMSKDRMYQPFGGVAFVQ